MSETMNAYRNPTPAEMARAVGLFKVLSHPDRLRLACALGDGHTTTQKELVEEFGWPQSTAARHIAALRNAGLVTAERDGSEVLLRLGNPVALHLLDTVCDFVHQPSGQPAPTVTDVTAAASRLWAPTPPLPGS
jgi:DNA-binding transcriptional ArsR family regulator